MLGEEKIKEKLILAYKISTLYVDSMASTSVISELTTVPNPTVKRYINIIKEKKEDYIRLLPKLVTEEKLLELQAKIDEQKNENINLNVHAHNEGLLSNFGERIEEIKELYEKTKSLPEEELSKTILNLQLSGLSMRKIAEATGVSLGRVHKIISNSKSK